MPRIHFAAITVTEDDIDINRHVNNLVYLRWMQDAATAHSAEQGWPFERYLALGAGWFVRSHFIEYLHPAFPDDALRLYTWVHGIDARTSTRRYCFVRDSDGMVIARAETLWAFVNFGKGRLVRIPDQVASAFPVVPDDDGELAALMSGTRRSR